MTLLSPPYALGAAGQVLSGKMLRLAEGAAFRNAATGVQGVSGVLYGPAGTMGELTLNSNTSLTIGPFRAVVQQTQDVTQGQYLVANDAAVTATTAVVAGAPTMPAQDASQFRRAYVLTYVADSQVSGVASSATTDRAVLDVLAGALAATSGAAAYPTVPPNALLLGELLIPPTGQAVTLTPYNPRTTSRGGILPVIADGVNRPGHDGDPGTHLGQHRDHPVNGLERWDGVKWSTPNPIGGWVDQQNPTYNYQLQTTFASVLPAIAGGPGAQFTVTVPAGRTLEVELHIPKLQLSASAGALLRLVDSSAGLLDGAEPSAGTSSVFMPILLRGSFPGDGNSHTVTAQAWSAVSTVVVAASAGTGAPVRLRYRMY